MQAHVSYDTVDNNATPRSISRSPHPALDTIPADVLAGFRRHIGYLRATHPDWLPLYHERLGPLVDELRQSGKTAEAARLAAFAALLTGGEATA